MLRFLVVAHKTARSRELLQALRRKLTEVPEARFKLLVPAELSGSRMLADEASRARAREALAWLEDQGVPMLGAKAGVSSPLRAIDDQLRQDYAPYEGILICTLPLGPSRWLGLDLVHRARSLFGLPVEHVVAHSQGPAANAPDASCRHTEMELVYVAEGGTRLYRCLACGEELPEDIAALSGSFWRP